MHITRVCSQTHHVALQFRGLGVLFRFNSKNYEPVDINMSYAGSHTLGPCPYVPMHNHAVVDTPCHVVCVFHMCGCVSFRALGSGT